MSGELKKLITLTTQNLLKISEECKLYKISGILLFAALAINITSIFVQVDTFRENAAIFAGCAYFAGELTEFKAHSSVLTNIGSHSHINGIVFSSGTL